MMFNPMIKRAAVTSVNLMELMHSRKHLPLYRRNLPTHPSVLGSVTHVPIRLLAVSLNSACSVIKTVTLMLPLPLFMILHRVQIFAVSTVITEVMLYTTVRLVECQPSNCAQARPSARRPSASYCLYYTAATAA